MRAHTHHKTQTKPHTCTLMESKSRYLPPVLCMTASRYKSLRFAPMCAHTQTHTHTRRQTRAQTHKRTDTPESTTSHTPKSQTHLYANGVQIQIRPPCPMYHGQPVQITEVCANVLVFSPLPLVQKPQGGRDLGFVYKVLKESAVVGIPTKGKVREVCDSQ